MSDNDCGFGDFEFERRFYVEHLPSVVLDDPTPTLIVQSYYLAEQGHALRVRAQATGYGSPWTAPTTTATSSTVIALILTSLPSPSKGR